MDFPSFLRQRQTAQMPVDTVLARQLARAWVFAISPVSLAFAVLLLSVVPAIAQSAAGTNTGARDGSVQSTLQARQLYETARDDYQQGYLKGAAHGLEDLIQHFPYSKYSDLARRDLRILYAKIKRRSLKRAERNRPAVTQKRGKQRQDRSGRQVLEQIELTKGERKFPTREKNSANTATAIPVPVPVPVPRLRSKSSRQSGGQNTQQQRRPRGKVRITIQRRAISPQKLSAPRRLSANERNEAFKEATVDRVFFGEMATRLGGNAVTVVVAQADWLKQHPGLVITVNGHADETGSVKLNRNIARQRAEAVRELLLTEGVEAARIRIIVHGRAKRVAVCDSVSCAVQNRRVITDVLSSSR